jgi:hypothetical protein
VTGGARGESCELSRRAAASRSSFFEGVRSGAAGGLFHPDLPQPNRRAPDAVPEIQGRESGRVAWGSASGRAAHGLTSFRDNVTLRRNETRQTKSMNGSGKLSHHKEHFNA